MADSQGEKKGDAVKVAQGRSPAYPYISLEKAVERADQIRAAGAARQEMPPETYYKIWDLGSQSSGARQTMAALNHFGLVDYMGRGTERKVKLSDLALRIVLDKTPGSPQRFQAVAEAAVKPAIHAELYDKYKSFLPDDVVIETFLTRDREYNEQAARQLIDEYKNTLRYSGLAEPDNMPKVGDDAGQKGQNENAGTPGKAGAAAVIPPPPPLKGKERLMEGERELTAGLLSKDSSFRLIVSGAVGVKEIERLIQKLEFDKEILAETSDAQSGDTPKSN